MQKKHGLVILGALAVIALLFWFLFPAGDPGKVDGKKLVAAAHAYTQQLRTNGAVLPMTVSLDELIAKGFLQHDDVSGFDGMKVVVYLVAKAGQPSVLVDASLPDGQKVQVLTDGTVVQPQ